MSNRQRGFTLIELLIGMAIVGILLAMGVPAYRGFLANSKIRNTASSIQDGLQEARSEAIKRNQSVEFLLFSQSGTDYNATLVNAVTANTSGPSWLVRTQDPSTGLYTHIDWKNGFTGSAQSSANSNTVTTTINANYPATFGSVIFNGLGGTSLGSQAIFDVNDPTAGACAADGGPVRCLRVQVSVAGQVHLCDPATSAPDTRACD